MRTEQSLKWQNCFKYQCVLLVLQIAVALLVLQNVLGLSTDSDTVSGPTTLMLIQATSLQRPPLHAHVYSHNTFCHHNRMCVRLFVGMCAQKGKFVCIEVCFLTSQFMRTCAQRAKQRQKCCAKTFSGHLCQHTWRLSLLSQSLSLRHVPLLSNSRPPLDTQ